MYNSLRFIEFVASALAFTCIGEIGNSIVFQRDVDELVFQQTKSYFKQTRYSWNDDVLQQEVERSCSAITYTSNLSIQLGAPKRLQEVLVMFSFSSPKKYFTAVVKRKRKTSLNMKILTFFESFMRSSKGPLQFF